MKTKAIVMAGGEGTRLRPVTEGLPKPMVPLPDAPVLEHILLLLRESGVREVCVTLRYEPEVIRQYFGDGSRLGMALHWSVEETPLGTAGGVAACREFLGQEDFFVISGDCVCGFDLQAAAAWHRQKESEATILLCSRKDPTSFGLARTDRQGRVDRFAEKPPWEAVFTDLVNAGIYVLSPSVLEAVPAGTAFDFGKDLFPALLRQGRAVFGYEASGYWCDVGTVGAYLGCLEDLLRGKLQSFPMPEDGRLCRSAVPAGVKLIPPVYIGEGVQLSAGAVIGPCAVIGSGSVVERGARAEHCAVSGGRLGQGCHVRGAVICRGGCVEKGARVEEGAVLGRGSIAGEGAVLRPGARVWPGHRISAGARVTGTVRGEGAEKRAVFAAPGVLRGTFGADLTPELCLRLGAAAAGLGGRVGCAHGGGEAARILADAFVCGVGAAGGSAVLPDCGFEAQAAFAAQRYHLPVTAFFRQRGSETEAVFFGEDGGSAGRDTERVLEQARETEPCHVPAPMAGTVTVLSDVAAAYLAAAARPGACEGLSAAVSGGGAENRALQAALAASGVRLAAPGMGTAAVTVLPGGFGLAAVLPDGRQIGPQRLLMAAALTELETGCGRIAVPYAAPGDLETMAAACGGTVLRLGRDGAQAEELSLRQPFLRDGVFAAVQIWSYLASAGLRLSELVDRTPEYGACRRVVPVGRDRAALMRVLTERFDESASELVGGLRVFTGRGRVTVSPMRGRSALSVQADGPSAEAARELCGDFDRLIRQAEAELEDRL